MATTYATGTVLTCTHEACGCSVLIRHRATAKVPTTPTTPVLAEPSWYRSRARDRQVSVGLSQHNQEAAAGQTMTISIIAIPAAPMPARVASEINRAGSPLWRSPRLRRTWNAARAKKMKSHTSFTHPGSPPMSPCRCSLISAEAMSSPAPAERSPAAQEVVGRRFWDPVCVADGSSCGDWLEEKERSPRSCSPPECCSP